MTPSGRRWPPHSPAGSSRRWLHHRRRCLRLFQTASSALGTLRANKRRSILTTLGIVVASGSLWAATTPPPATHLFGAGLAARFPFGTTGLGLMGALRSVTGRSDRSVPPDRWGCGQRGARPSKSLGTNARRRGSGEVEDASSAEALSGVQSADQLVHSRPFDRDTPQPTAHGRRR
jgi:hypothetical protein